jgi:hypothetical protein
MAFSSILALLAAAVTAKLVPKPEPEVEICRLRRELAEANDRRQALERELERAWRQVDALRREAHAWRQAQARQAQQVLAQQQAAPGPQYLGAQAQGLLPQQMQAMHAQMQQMQAANMQGLAALGAFLDCTCVPARHDAIRLGAIAD